MHIHKIELMLRRYIERAFPTEDELQQALLAGVCPHKRYPEQPSSPFDELDFGQELSVIECEANWSRFAAEFEPKQNFSAMLVQVRTIRNHVLHFRGPVRPTDHDAVARALTWMESRPHTRTLPNVEVRSDDAGETD